MGLPRRGGDKKEAAICGKRLERSSDPSDRDSLKRDVETLNTGRCAGPKPGAFTPHVSPCLPEMVESMKNVASMDVELTVEERNLLSVAYKNVIGARRASWRIISSLEQKEENKGGEDKLKMIREYRKTVRRCS